MVAGFVLMALIAGLFVKPESQIMMASPPSTVTSVVADSAMAEGSNVRAIGAVVMTKYIVATELSAILLLISMVGAIALSRRQVPSELGAKPRRPLGEIGKEVEAVLMPGLTEYLVVGAILFALGGWWGFWPAGT